MLSLIIYSLLLVISIKYIAIVMRADNQGEGGILALTALLPQRAESRAAGAVLVLLGIFGAALLYGDGMITPAITVLGAVEGLKVATPLFDPYVVPIAVVILIGVFAIQRHGTHRVGRLFGPIMVVWFVVIAVLGIVSLVAAAGRADGGRSRATRSPSSANTAGTASRCSARCSWWSPAARRSTRTWATSASGRSASPGSRWCCRRCC